MTQDSRPLERLARAAARRRALNRLEEAAVRWAKKAAPPLLAALLLDSLIPLSFSPRPALWTACLTAVALGTARAWRREKMVDALAAADERLGSNDLLATAHQLAAERSREPLAALVLARASALAPGVDAARLFPRRAWTRRELPAAAAYAAALAITLTAPWGPRLSEGAAYSEAARAEAARLAGGESALEEAGLKEEAKVVRDLRRSLKAGRLPRERALRALDAAEHGLKKAADVQEAGREAGELSRAGAELESGKTAAVGEAMRAADAGESARAMKRLADALRAEPAGGQEALASELKAAAAKLSGEGGMAKLKSALERAASALESGRSEEAASAMTDAARALEGASEAQAARRAAESTQGEMRRAQARLGGSGEQPSTEADARFAAGAAPAPGTGPAPEAAPAPGTGPAAGTGGAETQGPGQAGGPDSAPGGKGRLGELRRIQSLGAAQNLTLSGAKRGDENLLSSDAGAPSARNGEAAVPYASVLPRYSKAAEDAISHERVPPAYRQLVRDYFEVLQPPKGETKP